MSSFTKYTLFAATVITVHGIWFQKKISTGDPNYGEQFSPRNNVSAATSIQCASIALAALMLNDKSQRASAYNFDGQVCQLGQTPPFVDKIMDMDTIINRTVNGALAVIGIKPTSAEAHADLFAYILMNEQKYFNAHRNLPTRPNASFYDGINKYFEFTMLSPVQTLEGEFAAHPMNNAYLQFKIQPVTFQTITVLLWYNPGDQVQLNEPLIAMKQGDNVGTGFDLWAGYNTASQLKVSIYADLSWGSQSATSILPPNTWTYVGMAYNGLTGSTAIYINATLDAVGTGGYGNLTSLDTILISYCYGFYMKGYLASVEIYDSFLTESQVAASMVKSTTSRVQLV